MLGSAGAAVPIGLMGLAEDAPAPAHAACRCATVQGPSIRALQPLPSRRRGPTSSNDVGSISATALHSARISAISSGSGESGPVGAAGRGRAAKDLHGSGGPAAPHGLLQRSLSGTRRRLPPWTWVCCSP